MLATCLFTISTIATGAISATTSSTSASTSSTTAPAAAAAASATALLAWPGHILERVVAPPVEHLGLELVVRRRERGGTTEHDKVRLLWKRGFVLAVHVSHPPFDQVTIHGSFDLFLGGDDADASARGFLVIGVAEIPDADNLTLEIPTGFHHPPDVLLRLETLSRSKLFTGYALQPLTGFPPPAVDTIA